MLRTIIQLCRSWTTGYRASAPASTLLAATVFTLMVAGATRLAFGALPPTVVESHPAEIAVSPHASPGGVVAVAVESNRAEEIMVYLPGLSTRHTALNYEPRLGYHLGHLMVPQTAPQRGHFTVRVVFPDGAESDLRVALMSCACEGCCHPPVHSASHWGSIAQTSAGGAAE